MCPVPFNLARAFIALGSWLCVEGTKYVCRQGLLRMDLLLIAVGVEKRGRIFSWRSFYSGHHVTPRGCWYSVKLDHQFLNKFPQISSVCMYLCSCMYIMSILDSRADAVSSCSWPILFKVLTLNVAICIVCLHFSSFRCLSSVADFSNTELRAPTSAGRAPFLPAWRVMRFMYVVWVWVMVIFWWLFLFLIYRNHSYRWAAVVPRSNWQFWVLSRMSYTFRTRLGIAFGRQRV